MFLINNILFQFKSIGPHIINFLEVFRIILPFPTRWPEQEVFICVEWHDIEQLVFTTQINKCLTTHF
jgi:hypothetical protein